MNLFFPISTENKKKRLRIIPLYFVFVLGADGLYYIERRRYISDRGCSCSLGGLFSISLKNKKKRERKKRKEEKGKKKERERKKRKRNREAVKSEAARVKSISSIT
ncbi:hypothetical protein VTN96DRAFT_8042 [Rasamsonia emersonii]